MKLSLLPHTLVLLLSLALLTDPLDRVYHESTLSQDLAAILAQDTADSSAYKRINRYLLVMAFSEEQLTGKTYRQLLDHYDLWEVQQKRREAEAKAQAEQADREQEKRYLRLSRVVSATLMGRETTSCDSTESVMHCFTLKNRSRRPIREIQGLVEINYGQSAYFQRVDLAFEEPLPGGASHRASMQFTGDTGHLKGQKGKLIWRPERIRFADGQLLE